MLQTEVPPSHLSDTAPTGKGLGPGLLKASSAWAHELQPLTPPLPHSQHLEYHSGWSELSPGSQGQNLGIKKRPLSSPCPPRLYHDPSRSERAKMVLRERMKTLTSHFFSPISPQKSLLSLEGLRESPARGSKRASQPHSTAGFTSKEAVPETQPHQPCPKHLPDPSS